MAKVLIIEDSPTELHALSRVLRKSGFEVETAINGEQGISKAVESSPDVILMDIVMPGVNGFQATRELQKLEETAEIPVVIITTKDQETDRIWGLRQGATEYLVKPVKNKTLIACVKSAIASVASS